MGFKENLKSELLFQNLLVKELAVKTGISKRTLDNYLRDKNSEPTAENAVKIAQTLGVSTEYLVTGSDSPTIPKENAAIIHHITSDLQSLDTYDLVSISTLVRRMSEK